MSRWHSCNVLQVGPDAQRVWQFDARNGDFVLSRQETATADQPLPYSLVTKTWRSLWQAKLNVAWLPPESAFLRVAHLPQSSLTETVSMVELQLEKLSPIPVTQVVWSVHVLPQTTVPAESSEGSAPKLQTVIVLLAERKAVEEFLGQLEGQGYLADRLEIPVLDQLEATEVTEDGAWIYPEAIGGHNHALVAWWYGGVLQNLNLVSLPVEGDRAAAVREQLAQVAWAGELEGWLSAPPLWHLVADEALAVEWEPPLRNGLNEPIRVVSPRPSAELAALTARRAADAEAKSSLLPAEFSTRYQQQFVDRLWIRGLFAVGGLYLIGVLIYGLALFGFFLRTQSVERRVTGMSGTYTNAIELKARHEVLKDRQALKFAALDCWKAVADVMPNDLALDNFNFRDGHELRLTGTAPAGEAQSLLEFFDQLRKAKIGDQPLFDPNKGDSAPRSGTKPGGGITWNFTFDLKRTEAQ